MKSQINEIYNMPMCRELRYHLVNNMGFCEVDKSIITSLMFKSGSSDFHYCNTDLPRDKFERRLRNINNIVFAELINLANAYFKKNNI